MNHMPKFGASDEKVYRGEREMKKQIEDYIREKSMRLKEEIVAKASESNGIKVMQFVGKANADAMKNVAFQIKRRQPIALSLLPVSLTITNARSCLC